MEINTLKYRKKKPVELIKELFPEEKIPNNIISIGLVKKKLVAGGGGEEHRCTKLQVRKRNNHR